MTISALHELLVLSVTPRVKFLISLCQKGGVTTSPFSLVFLSCRWYYWVSLNGQKGGVRTRSLHPKSISFVRSIVSSLSVRSRAILEVSTRLGDILDALDLEFGFSRVDFPPKGSKTQSFCVILAKTSFFELPVGIPTGSYPLEFQQVAKRWNSNR